MIVTFEAELGFLYQNTRFDVRFRPNILSRLQGHFYIPEVIIINSSRLTKPLRAPHNPPAGSMLAGPCMVWGPLTWNFVHRGTLYKNFTQTQVHSVGMATCIYCCSMYCYKNRPFFVLQRMLSSPSPTLAVPVQGSTSILSVAPSSGSSWISTYRPISPFRMIFSFKTAVVPLGNL